MTRSVIFRRFLRTMGVLSLMGLLMSATTAFMSASERPSVIINQVDSTQFPNTVAYVTVLSPKGLPVHGLTSENFRILENAAAAQTAEISTSIDASEPLAAVLTLDVSGSMDEATMTAEKNAATAFLAGLRAQDQASILSFSTAVQPVMNFTSDKQALSNALGGLTPGGNTALYDALFQSVQSTTTTAPSRRIVVLMTDGRNTKSEASLEDGLNLAVQLGVPVYTVGVGSDVDQVLLDRIARQTGGSSIYAKGPEALAQAYQTILDQLRSQYVIRYQSPQPQGARTYNLGVTANIGNDSIVAERTYEASLTAPQITTLSLQDGQVLDVARLFSVDVAAKMPVARVQLSVNGRLKEERMTAPFDFTLDPAQLPTGRQEISVSVTDVAGGESSKRISVMVPPTGSLTGTIPAPAPAVSAQPAPVAQPSSDGFTLPSVGVPSFEAPAIAMPSVSMPSVSLPEVTLPSISVPAVSMPEISLPTINMPSITPPTLPDPQAQINAISAGVTATTDEWRASATAVIDNARTQTEAMVTTIYRTAQESAPKASLAGMLFAASLSGLIGTRRTLRVGRERLGTTTCEKCGNKHRVYETECYVCQERAYRAQLENRSLAEVLLQNNLVSSEDLHKALQISETSALPLEIVILDNELVSAAELSKARFYLTQSSEMQERLRHEDRRRPATMSKVIPQVLRLVPSASLMVVAVATWAAAPTLWQLVS